MSTNGAVAGARPSTFTQVKRRAQFVDCAIDAIVDLGYQGASVAEVARRAGVSKGVVTYHFAAKDDLIMAVVSRVFDSVAEHLRARLTDTTPQAFVADYIGAWVDYYRTRTRYMLAMRDIWSSFRDESGRQRLGPDTGADELAMIEHALRLGQERGCRGPFSPRVMAVTMKGALDRLLGLLVAEPGLDLQAYGAELIALFERATSPGTPAPDSVRQASERQQR